MSHAASSAETQKLWELIKDIGFAMLVTEDEGELRSRPMVASQQAFDGALWFFTRASTHKVQEVQRNERVNVSYADPNRQHYVSVSGTASLVRDPAEIRAHWREAFRTWFPKGSDDPDIALLKVDVHRAEYWDAPSSTMVHAYGYAKAVLTGTPPHPGENRKLDLA